LDAVPGWDKRQGQHWSQGSPPIRSPFFHTDMTREFEQLERVFGWSADDFRALNATALDAAFCDAGTKEALAKILKN